MFISDLASKILFSAHKYIINVEIWGSGEKERRKLNYFNNPPSQCNHSN